MKKKVSVLAIFLIAVIAVILFFSVRIINLDDLIKQYLGTQEEYDVLSIEKMEVNQEPVIIGIDQSSDKEMILECIRDSKVRFKAKETGMEINAALYTIRVSGNDAQLSITVNENNEIHFNLIESTYKMKSKVDLYQVLKNVFDSKS